MFYKASFSNFVFIQRRCVSGCVVCLVVCFIILLTFSQWLINYKYIDIIKSISIEVTHLLRRTKYTIIIDNVFK